MVHIYDTSYSRRSDRRIPSSRPAWATYEALSQNKKWTREVAQWQSLSTIHETLGSIPSTGAKKMGVGRVVKDSRTDSWAFQLEMSGK